MLRARGSITVFLSLISILIFALFGTLLETARYRVCRNYAGRILRTSAEALLTEYSRPLYEHYGLFFIEKAGTPYEKVMGEYIGDTFSAAGDRDMDFLEGGLEKIEVSDYVYPGDDGAAALQKEINSYMGRVVTKEQMEKFLSCSKELSDVEEQAKKIEENVEQEEKAAKMDTELLELMKLVDGISVSDGKITCEDEFVKMFAVGKKQGQNFGVTEGAVWKVMKPHIDDSVKTWSISDKASFLARIRRVKEKTKKAISTGEKIVKGIAGYKGDSTDEHDRMLASLSENLPALERNKEILEQTEKKLNSHSVKECKKELSALWKDYDTVSIAFDYTGAEEMGGGDNPKDSFGDAWQKGILNLVCEKPSALSKKTISNPDSYAEYYKVQREDGENYGDRVSSFVSADDVSLSGILGDMATYGMNEFCLDQYILRQFGGYEEKIEGTWKQPLDYGWEYVVAGKASDQENLKSVLNRILLIRTVVNFIALEQDSVRKKEAYAAAAAIVGFTGLAPLIKLTQTLILLTWSLSESLVDITAILQNRHVPVIKSKKHIVTGFTEIVQMGHDSLAERAKKFEKEKKNSFGYTEYILLFLALTGQNTRRYRIMDLIQAGMKKNGYSSFNLGSCVYEMKVQGDFRFPSRFFRMVPLEKLLGRSINECQIMCEIWAGYYQ